jgi:hypothetical protein
LNVYRLFGLLSQRHDAEVHPSGIESYVGPRKGSDLKFGRRAILGPEFDLDRHRLRTLETVAIHLDVDESGLARFEFLRVAKDARAAAGRNRVLEDLHGHGIDVGDDETVCERRPPRDGSEVVEDDRGAILGHEELVAPRSGPTVLCNGGGRKCGSGEKDPDCATHRKPPPLTHFGRTKPKSETRLAIRENYILPRHLGEGVFDYRLPDAESKGQ